jgi:hypothetical protein
MDEDQMKNIAILLNSIYRNTYYLGGEVYLNKK